MKKLNNILFFFEHTLEGLESKLGDELASTIYAFISAIINVWLLVWSKINANRINTIQVNIIRGLSQFIISYIIMAEKKIPFNERIADLNKTKILRNVLSIFFNLAMYYVLTKLTLSVIIIIQLWAPFIIAIMDYLILNLKYTYLQGFLGFASTFGVLLVTDPSFFDPDFAKQNIYKSYAQGAEKYFCICLYFTSMVIWAYSVILIKRLKGINPISVNCPFGIILAIFSAVTQIFMEDLQATPLSLVLEIFFYTGIFSFLTIKVISRSKINMF